jgi:restriction system protein
MARRNNRKHNASSIELLTDAPWQISVVLSVTSYISLKWVIPASTTSPYVYPMVTMLYALAPFIAIGFLIVAAISYFRNIEKNNFRLRSNSLRSDYSTEKNHYHYIDIPGNANSAIRPHINISEWSIELLKVLEWKRFEILAAEYFRMLNKRVETISHGPDGGVDARIYGDNDILEYVIQCKAWNSIVGVKPVRELFGVMAHESAGQGIFMTTSIFSEDAKKFAIDHADKLFLVDGKRFLVMINLLSDDLKRKLLAIAIEGDYTTPSCASCGIKMIRRFGKSGEFWGCSNFPHCKTILKIAHPEANF